MTKQQQTAAENAEQVVDVGVVGVGALGQHHARIYAGLAGARLAGVYDVDGARACEVAARHGCRAFSSLAELSGCCRAASVVVPTDLHFAVAGELLGAGLDLLVEKPLCDTVARAEELVACAEASGRVLHVGHVERFNPVMEYLEAAVNRPRFIEAHRLSTYPPSPAGGRPRGTEVGVVLDLMIHDLEVILELVRAPVAGLSAVGVPVLSPHEDIANARIEFGDGCVANVTASRVSAERMRKIRVFQEGLYLSLDYGAQQGRLHRLSGGQIRVEDVPLGPKEPLRCELEVFVRAVIRGGGSDGRGVSGRRGLEALRLAARVTEAIRARAARGPAGTGGGGE